MLVARAEQPLDAERVSGSVARRPRLRLDRAAGGRAGRRARVARAGGRAGRGAGGAGGAGGRRRGPALARLVLDGGRRGRRHGRHEGLARALLVGDVRVVQVGAVAARLEQLANGELVVGRAVRVVWAAVDQHARRLLVAPVVELRLALVLGIELGLELQEVAARGAARVRLLAAERRALRLPVEARHHGPRAGRRRRLGARHRGQQAGARRVARPAHDDGGAAALLVRVQRLVVSAQVDLPLEGARTAVARVGLVAGVLPRVGDQIGGLAEGLAANLAGVRLLARVDVGVLLHVRLLVEALLAEAARVGARVRVDQQVGGERGAALEGLAALATQERAAVRAARARGLRRVRQLVRLQVRRVDAVEAGAAVAARVARAHAAIGGVGVGVTLRAGVAAVRQAARLRRLVGRARRRLQQVVVQSLLLVVVVQQDELLPLELARAHILIIGQLAEVVVAARRLAARLHIGQAEVVDARLLLLAHHVDQQLGRVGGRGLALAQVGALVEIVDVDEQLGLVGLVRPLAEQRRGGHLGGRLPAGREGAAHERAVVSAHGQRLEAEVLAQAARQQLAVGAGGRRLVDGHCGRRPIAGCFSGARVARGPRRAVRVGVRVGRVARCC